MIKIYRTKEGNVQWQHTCSFTEEEKRKIEEVMKKEHRTFNGTIRHMIRTYEMME